MDAFRDSLEAELREFSAPEALPLYRSWFRETCGSPLPEMRNPYCAFMHVIPSSSRAKEIEVVDALRGGLAHHILCMLDRLPIPEQYAWWFEHERSNLSFRAARSKVAAVIKLIRDDGLTKEAVQAKKEEIGWGDLERKEMERQLSEIQERERELAQ